MLIRAAYRAEPFVDPVQLLAAYEDDPAACVLTDVMMGDMDGFAFAERLRVIDPAAALVFMTAWPTTANAVDAVRRYGGVDYLEKPIDLNRLIAAVQEGVAWSIARRRQLARTSRLSPREREVFQLLIRGLSNKAIAAELKLSPKTVEDHRAQISAKTETSGLAQLIALGEPVGV